MPERYGFDLDHRRNGLDIRLGRTFLISKFFLVFGIKGNVLVLNGTLDLEFLTPGFFRGCKFHFLLAFFIIAQGSFLTIPFVNGSAQLVLVTGFRFEFVGNFQFNLFSFRLSLCGAFAEYYHFLIAVHGAIFRSHHLDRASIYKFGRSFCGHNMAAGHHQPCYAVNQCLHFFCFSLFLIYSRITFLASNTLG